MKKNRIAIKEEAKLLVREHSGLKKLVLIYSLFATIITLPVNYFIIQPAQEQLQILLSLIQGGLTAYYSSEEISRMLLEIVGQELFGNVLQVLLACLSAVLLFGLLRAVRRMIVSGDTPAIGDLSEGFPRSFRISAMHILTYLFTILWSFLIFIPFFVILFVILFFIGNSAPVLALQGILLFLLAAFVIVFTVCLFCIMARYEFSFYHLAEHPESTARQSLRASVSLFRAQRGEVVLFILSFLGWDLLTVLINTAASYIAASFLSPLLASVIGLLAALPLQLWLNSYRFTATTLYYRSLTGQDDQPALRDDEAPPPPPDSYQRDSDTGSSYF